MLVIILVGEAELAKWQLPRPPHRQAPSRTDSHDITLDQAVAARGKSWHHNNKGPLPYHRFKLRRVTCHAGGSTSPVPSYSVQ